METTETLREIIEPVVSDLGFELVEVQLRREQVGLVLRIIIHNDAGVSLDNCTQVSREVGYILEVDDPITGAYSLEVSSPGLDRPLITFRDFERNVGKKVAVTFEDASGERKQVSGTIGEVTAENGQETFFLMQEKGVINIDLAMVCEAKLVIEF